MSAILECQPLQTTTSPGRIIKLAGMIEQSIVDGPGLRMVVFAQGCPHKCAGCHNPATHAFRGGSDHTVATLLEVFDENPLLSGITLSGGEPLAQAAGLVPLAREIKARGKNVWCYTGYTFEEVLAASKVDVAVHSLLRYVDVMVDGRFEQERKSVSLQYRGSANQRLVNVPKSLEKKMTVLM